MVAFLYLLGLGRRKPTRTLSQPVPNTVSSAPAAETGVHGCVARTALRASTATAAPAPHRPPNAVTRRSRSRHHHRRWPSPSQEGGSGRAETWRTRPRSWRRKCAAAIRVGPSTAAHWQVSRPPNGEISRKVEGNVPGTGSSRHQRSGRGGQGSEANAPPRWWSRRAGDSGPTPLASNEGRCGAPGTMRSHLGRPGPHSPQRRTHAIALGQSSAVCFCSC